MVQKSDTVRIEFINYRIDVFYEIIYLLLRSEIHVRNDIVFISDCPMKSDCGIKIIHKIFKRRMRSEDLDVVLLGHSDYLLGCAAEKACKFNR